MLLNEDLHHLTGEHPDRFFSNLKKEKLNYLHKTQNAKVKGTIGDTFKSKSAIRLRISHLPIDEVLKEKLTGHEGTE